MSTPYKSNVGDFVILIFMNSFEKLNRKLYNPRDIEGSPNLEMFRAVDIVHEALFEQNRIGELDKSSNIIP